MTRAASVTLALALTAGGAAAETPSLPKEAKVRSAISLPLELHNFLQILSQGQGEVRPEYLSEVRAYKQARELIKDPAAWRYISDACVAGPDMSGVLRRGESLPAGLEAPEKEGLRLMFDALASAWPRFEAHDGPRRNRSLQTVMTRTLRRSFGVDIEPRIMGTLYKTMSFRPLDAPVTVYPVIDALEAGMWGKTADGYYIVLPVARRENLHIVENLLHEITHVLDVNQPPAAGTFLQRLRTSGGSADPQALGALIHGLIAWNAGDMIRRYLKEDYVPVAERAEVLRRQIDRYLPSYEGAWIGYVEGRLTADQAIEGMISGLKPAGAGSSSGL